MNGELFHYELSTGTAVALLLGLLLWLARPRDRGPIRVMMIVLALFVLIAAAGTLAADAGYPRAASVAANVAAVGVGAVLIRLAMLLLFRLLLARLQLARIIEDLTTTVLTAGWLLLWLYGAGFDPGSLLTTSAVLTAVLAFSMQDTLGNVLGGIVLQLDASVRVGDWIQIDTVTGQVVDVGWRHTAIETRNRETVVIPNGWLVKNRFTVIGSRNDPKLRWRRWVWFDLDPSAAPSRVCQVLEDAVNGSGIPNALADPPPSAVLMQVGNGVARYALRYWVSDPRPDDPTDSAVRIHALAALDRQAIPLAVVREERRMMRDDDAHVAALQATEMARRRHALDGVELFGSLDEHERDQLAAALVKAPFVQGDTMTRQGAVAHWLYLISSGEADVWAEHAGGRTHVATLKTGSVFGEMGLMTGEPRGATVTARTDVDCYRLDKAAFESVLRARPDLANDISAVIARRRGELDAVRETAAVGRASPQNDAIRARIRSFFGIASD